MNTENTTSSPVAVALLPCLTAPCETAHGSRDDGEPRQTGKLRRVRSKRWLVVLTLFAATLGAAEFTYFRHEARHYRRALEALAHDDFDGARYELLRLEALPEYEEHASLIKGILLLEEQKPNDALDEFALAAEHPDTRALALTLAGRTLHFQHRFHEAEHTLLAAIQADPKQAEAHRWLGVAYYDVGAMAQADSHLRRAADLAPLDPRPHRVLGTIYLGFDDVQAAIQNFQEALRRDAACPRQLKPHDRREMLLELAECQAKQSRHADALATLQDVADSADVLAQRAESHWAIGQKQEAEICLEQALRIDSEHLPSLLANGRFMLESNEPASALDILRCAVEGHPQDETSHYLLSQTYHILGQEESARRHADLAAEIHGLSVEFAALNRRAMDEPKQPDICFQLGLMAERLDMLEVAASWYRATLILNPRHAGAQGRLFTLPAARLPQQGNQ
jgi:tetratricopeptide (TPR) repeat protein